MGGGRYETLFQLARGGMATVYVGTVRGAFGFRQLVAIKRPHAHLLGDADFKRDLLTEARLASLLHHANIVDVRDVEIVDEHISLVMDYVEGASLGELLQNALCGGPAVAPALCVRIILDALAGLHAAHELRDERGRHVQLVHRDISPQNLLVGVDGVTRVADFGVAKVDRRSGGTTDGHLKGKLAYMAPEYLRGEAIDRRFDIFAMGVVLWEGLTGQRLFKGEHEADTLRRVLELAPPPPSQAAASLGTALDAVVETALNKPREHRFENAAAMASALEASGRAAGLVAPHSDVAALVRASVGARLDERRALLQQRLASEPSALSVFGETAPSTVAADTIPEAAAAPTLASPAAPNAATLRSGEAAASPIVEKTRASASPAVSAAVAATLRDAAAAPDARPPLPAVLTMEPSANLPMSMPSSVPVSPSPLRWVVPLVLVTLVVGAGTVAVTRVGGAPSSPAHEAPSTSAAQAPSAPPVAEPGSASSTTSAAAPLPASASAHGSPGTVHTGKPRATPPPQPPHRAPAAGSTTPSTDPPPNPYAK